MIRPVAERDVDQVVGLIHDLAEYERSDEPIEGDRDLLAAALFGPGPRVFAHVAEEAGEVVGVAIWFISFSTWTGHHGIYLEDLYVRPEHRGTGIGKALLTELAAIAVREGYKRIDWSVLDWNEPAIGFYRTIGAEPMEGWTGYRLSGAALADLGRTGPRG